MQILVWIFLVIMIIQSGLLLWQRKQGNVLQEEYKKNNEMLTRYVAANLDMEKKLMEMNQDYAKQQDMAKEIQKIQEQSRLLKHDMKNHTLVMLSYLEEGRITEAKQYASDILDKLNKMYTYVNVGNSLLNYIINHKLSRAKEMGIEIKAEIENLAFSYMDSVDFSALLNNMMDNAIEGALESYAKKLELSIANRKGCDTITVRNTIDASVLENNPDFTSTKKEDGHGYGVKQIEKITEKYHGMTDRYERSGMFILSVIFQGN